MISVESYLTFSEFNGGDRPTERDFREELARYSLQDVLHFCVAANIVIYGVEPNPNRAAQNQLVRHACMPEILRLKIAAALNSRPLFHRQQLLFVAKESLIVCRDVGLPLKPGRELARLFLMANDEHP